MPKSQEKRLFYRRVHSVTSHFGFQMMTRKGNARISSVLKNAKENEDFRQLNEINKSREGSLGYKARIFCSEDN